MSERLRITAALGVVQILTWGSSFYLLAVLGDAIARDMGWSRAVVMAGVSIGLLISAAMAPVVARAIARHGGRATLRVGVLGLAASLAALSLSQHVAVYLLVWVFIGASMAATLYEAAFTTLGTIYGRSARGAITALTLWGGFASTLCWPLSAFLVETIGWRGTCLTYAGLHLFVCLPLVHLAVPSATAGPAGDDATGQPVPWNDRRYLTLAAAGVGLAFVFATISTQLIPILTAQGLALSAAVAVGALIGPAQVGARLLEMSGRERHAPIVTLWVAGACVTAGLAALSFGVWAGLSVVIYGCGTGLWSIARGTVPLASFGADAYAGTMGRIAVPVLGASAVAPVLGAMMLDRIGPTLSLYALTCVAGLALLAAGLHGHFVRNAHQQVH